jgi:hypothetical protein
MIDLETLGTGADALFTTLGACVFDPETGKIGDTFYEAVDWGSAERAGRKIDASTVRWWMEQDAGARDAMMEIGSPLEVVLREFQLWLPGRLAVWSNGSNFDIAILEHAYNGNPPWHFRDVRDVRTIVAIAKGVIPREKDDFVGTKHHALHDAAHQAKYVSAMWQKLRWNAQKAAN